jgi:hypothetical protein
MISRHLAVSVARRHASSSIKDRVGTIKRRPKLPTTSSSSPPPLTSSTAGAADTGEFAEEPIALVSTETKVKNLALASGLAAFCFGVALYSMKSVGQAGSDPSDPLSTLREEAAEARERQDREERSVRDASEMLRQFRAGEHDPDRYDDLERKAGAEGASAVAAGAPDGKNNKKRPWYKFW